MNTKKIIFLDGDGTLWYPSKTKRTQKPHWIYHDNETKNNYLYHLELTPNTAKTLKTFHEKGIYSVVLSANPNPEEIAVNEIKEKLEYFEIIDFFYSIQASDGNNPNGKSEKILNILNKLNFDKKDALMVGDSFYYDYLAAKNIGIDAFWIKNNVCKLPEEIPNDIKIICEIEELVENLDII